MSKKVLVNGITLEGANIVPLLLKVKEWQSSGYSVTFFGTQELKKQIESVGTVINFQFIELSHSGKRDNKWQFIYEAIRRNWHAIFQARHFVAQFDVIYTIAPVLDLVILPCILKKMNRNLRWVTVFDNTVPLFVDGKFVAGNKLTRLLAWLFYEISIFFLRSADRIFVIKPVLKEYFLKKGFCNEKIIVTGNGVEKDLIQKAKAISGFNADALFIGRINAAKGIYDMLKVLDIVRRRYPNFQLAIMGKGDEPTEKNFRKKITELGLDKNIIFLGYKVGQEKFDYIKSSKVFLFLSETESVPIAPLEAVCSGLKTIVYDLEAYSMYENDEVIILRKNDYEGVAKKIIDIFDSKDFQNPRGKLLLDRYSWTNIAHIEMSVMQNL